MAKESPLSKKKDTKGKKKHRLHMHIRPTDDGQFRVDQSHMPHPEDDSPVPASEEHNLPDANALSAHVAEAYNQPDPETPPDGAAPPQGPSPQPTPAQGQI